MPRLKVRIRTGTPSSDQRVAPGKYCNARRSSGQLCRRVAGYRTSHLGQGRCFRHGGAAPNLTSGRYSQIEHHRLRDILSRLSETDTQAMDLIPEANLLRAMTIDYVNRYDTFIEALMAWYADPESNSRPRRVMDLQDASHLVESISRVVQRLHQIQSTGAISLETFKRVTEYMGVIVARHVPETVVLNRIEKEWGEIALDSKTPPPPSSTPTPTHEGDS